MRPSRLLALLAFVSLTACLGRPIDDAFALAPGDVWIQDVTLVSPERDAPLPHAHIVVRDGRIASVATSVPRAGTADVTVIPGEGRFVTPGLIDGHVHLSGVPGMRPEDEQVHPAIVEAFYRQLPRSYLFHGFTTVVDLNVVDPAQITRVTSQDPAPAVVHCGGAITVVNGYPMVSAPPAVRFALMPNFLYDPAQAEAIPLDLRPEDHTPEAVVERVASGGGRCVKAFYESGFADLAGKLPVPSMDQMRRLREASRRRGFPLLMHANSISAQRVAAEIGADAVVHGMWNWNARNSETTLPDDARNVLDMARMQQIGMMPTSRVVAGNADLFDAAFLERAEVARVLPADLVAWYRTEPGRWFARELGAGFDGAPPERIRQIFRGVEARGLAAASYVAKNGGRIVFGSDTPSGPVYTNPPGLNGYLELRALEGAGLSPRLLLAAATLENAKLFGLTADYGVVAPGKVASLLILRSDPLASTAAFDTLETVVLRGRVLTRQSLEAPR